MVTNRRVFKQRVEFVRLFDSELEIVTQIQLLRCQQIGGCRRFAIPTAQIEIPRRAETFSEPEMERQRSLEDLAVRRDDHQAG